MFNLKEFLMQGLLDAVGKMPDYWVVLNAMGWFEKGVLDEESLSTIQNAVGAKEPV